MMQTELPQSQKKKKKYVVKLKEIPLAKSNEMKQSIDVNFYPVYKGVSLTTQEKKIVQSITIIFESWQPWQREFFFTSLINHYNKSQLHGLSSAMESLFHRDFIAVCRNAYPMHRIRERQHVHSCELFDYYSANNITHSERGLTHSMKLESKLSFDLNFKFASDTLVLKNSKSTDYKSKKLKEYQFKRLSQIKSSEQSKPVAQSCNETLDVCTNTNSINDIDNREDNSLLMLDGTEISSSRSSFITVPSVWAMGQSKENSSVGDCESQVTLDKRTEEYFPAISRPNLQSHFVITPKMCVFDKFMQKFNESRNKVPLPTTLQMNKNNKFWSANHPTVASTNVRLKELFQKQISQIWEWINNWEDHRKMRLFLHLLSLSQVEEQKYVAESIKQKFNEIKALEKWKSHLPYKFWLQLVDYLKRVDVDSSEAVCLDWNNILTKEDFWITKCNEIAKKLKIPNLVQQLANKYPETYANRWKETYFILRKYRKSFDGTDMTSLEEMFGENFEANNIITHRHSSSLIVTHRSLQAEDPQAEDPQADESGSVSCSSLTQIDPKEKKKKKKIVKPTFYFPLLKERLESAKAEMKSRAQKIKEEQEQLRLLEEENRNKELKQRKLRQIEEIIYSVRPLRKLSKASTPPRSGGVRSEGVRFSAAPPSTEPSRPGFLNIWNTIVEDIKEKDDKKKKLIRTEKIKVPVINDLLTPEEIEYTARKSGYIAVDYWEEGTQTHKSWLSDTYVPPVTGCVALKGHVGPIWCILAHGKRNISGGLDRKVHFWARNGDCYASIDDCAKGGITCMAIGADERCRTLYTGSWDRTVSVFDSVSFKKSAILTGHSDVVSGLVVNSDSIISSSYDCTVRVWDVWSHRLRRIIRPHSSSIFCVALRDHFLVTGGADRLVVVSDVRTGELLREFEGHKALVTSVKIRNNLVVSSDSQGFVFFWSLSGATKPVFSMRAHDKRINSIAISPKRIFTASSDRQVKEWNLLTMSCVRILQGHTRAVTDVKYTPDYLLTCSKDGSVRVWWWKDMEQDRHQEEEENTNTNKLRDLFRGHLSP